MINVGANNFNMFLVTERINILIANPLARGLEWTISVKRSIIDKDPLVDYNGRSP